LKRRFEEHNQGLAPATKNRRPFGLVYYEAYRKLTDARRRETRLKKFKNSYTELKKRIKDSLEFDKT
jgi:predicted GIY-YIG superfamily endonuclease